MTDLSPTSPWTEDTREARILDDVEAIIDLLRARRPSEALVSFWLRQL